MSMEYFQNLKPNHLKSLAMIEATEMQMLTLILAVFTLGLLVGNYLAKN